MSLNISGLMCIPPINENPNLHFKNLQSMALENNLNEISIGMSNDYVQAINFNPTYIRLGTILLVKEIEARNNNTHEF